MKSGNGANSEILQAADSQDTILESDQRFKSNDDEHNLLTRQCGCERCTVTHARFILHIGWDVHPLGATGGVTFVT